MVTVPIPQADPTDRVTPTAGGSAGGESGAALRLDHVTARWEGLPLTSQSALMETEDGATIITETIKDDEGKDEAKTFPQKVVKASYRRPFSFQILGQFFTFEFVAH